MCWSHLGLRMCCVSVYICVVGRKMTLGNVAVLSSRVLKNANATITVDSLFRRFKFLLDNFKIHAMLV